jgi:cell wall-associated NlpC family hydrolase
MNSAQTVKSLIENWKVLSLTKAELIVKCAEAMLGWPYAWGSTGQNCTVANRQTRIRNPRIAEGDIKLIKKRCQVLNGTKASCDGCLYYPDGVTQMFDCIGFVNRLLDVAGVPHYGAGCSTMWNHQANWKAKGKISDIPETVCLVFQQSKSNPQTMEHIGVYIGGGYVIHCSVEVKREKVSQYPWTHFGILNGMEGDEPLPVWRSTIRKGSTGDDVKYCQEMLMKLGYDIGSYGADGKFGAKTQEAVKAFQRDHGLNPDGVVGPLTWDAIEEAAPDGSLYTVSIPHLPKYKAEALVKAYAGASMIKEEEHEAQ